MNIDHNIPLAIEIENFFCGIDETSVASTEKHTQGMFDLLFLKYK